MYRVKRDYNQVTRSGFTLIEILIVIAVLGIILAIGISTYLRESRVSLVRQAAVQLQVGIENLRSRTIRFNRDATFTRISATQVQYAIPTSNTASPLTVETLQPGVTIALESGTDTFTYSAPLSTIDATPNVYRVEVNGVLPLYVKIIGVTGKVIVSATN
jgi:type IV pilus assembly protein PilA